MMIKKLDFRLRKTLLVRNKTSGHVIFRIAKSHLLSESQIPNTPLNVLRESYLFHVRQEYKLPCSSTYPLGSLLVACWGWALGERPGPLA